jgi:hypothetical protein
MIALVGLRVPRRRVWTVAIAAVLAAALATGLSRSLPGAHARAAATSAAGGGKSFHGTLTYTEVNPGRTQGASQVGIEGKGRFSAKLGARAAVSAVVIALATGVPATKIARGGTYTVKRTIGAHGTITGTAVARFTSRGLGTVCLTYTEKPGKYVIGSSFVPMSGTIRSIGGSGAAARWHISISFTQTDVTGITTETFSAAGAEHISIGNARRMTTACRQVAKIR